MVAVLPYHNAIYWPYLQFGNTHYYLLPFLCNSHYYLSLTFRTVSILASHFFLKLPSGHRCFIFLGFNSNKSSTAVLLVVLFYWEFDNKITCIPIKKHFLKKSFCSNLYHEDLLIAGSAVQLSFVFC